MAMNPSTDREWLLRMAALEDGCYVGAGIACDVVLADISLPTYCGCNELLQDLQQLESHVERGCWRKT